MDCFLSRVGCICVFIHVHVLVRTSSHVNLGFWAKFKCVQIRVAALAAYCFPVQDLNAALLAKSQNARLNPKPSQGSGRSASQCCSSA